MLYIIAVNASILSDSGGTCECTDDTDPTCLEDPDYNACVSDLRRQLVIATAAISCIGSFLMGLRECTSSARSRCVLFSCKKKKMSQTPNLEAAA